MAKRTSTEILEEFQAPKKKLESAGDLLIKELLQKQQNVKINLREQLAHKKEFEESKKLIQLTSTYQGTCTSENLKKWDEEIGRLEELQALGLSTEEIALYKNYESKGINFLYETHKNLDKLLLVKNINRIETIIKDKSLKPNNLSKNLEDNNVYRKNPHLMIKPDSIETKLLKFTMMNQQNKIILKHPMDEIKDLEKKYNEMVDISTDSVYINKIRRKARKLGNKICQPENDPKTLPMKGSSNWDVREIIEENITSNQNTSIKNYTCKPRNFYTIKNSEIISINSNNTEPVEFGETKMKLEEILKISKFKNYSKGDISKVLYVRNLPKAIKEIDLRQLFIKFDQNNELEFKLMNGKMKGQAFITFTDENNAVQALDVLNGTLINGKPVIIEFGKKV